MKNIAALKTREASKLAAIAKKNATAAKWEAAAAKKFAAIEDRGARVNAEDRTAEGALEAWRNLNAAKEFATAELFYSAHTALENAANARDAVATLESELAAIRADIASEEDRKAAIPEALKTLQATQEKEIAEAMKDAREFAKNALQVKHRIMATARDAYHSEHSAENASAFRLAKADYENTKATAGWTDAHIASEAAMAAEALVVDLNARVRRVCGEVTSWSGIRHEVGTHGMTCINGFVTGTQGRAEVRSIVAGGYNIVCRHIRVLVLEAK